jgi:hypothetical protein
MAACAVPASRDRMKFADPTKPRQEIRAAPIHGGRRVTFAKDSARLPWRLQHRGVQRFCAHLQEPLKSSRAAFAVADADGFVDPGDEDFAVPDLPRSGRCDDGLNRLFQQFVRDHGFDLDLG